MENNKYQKEQFSSYIEQTENNTKSKINKDIISFFENYFYKNYKT